MWLAVKSWGTLVSPVQWHMSKEARNHRQHHGQVRVRRELLARASCLGQSSPCARLLRYSCADCSVLCQGSTLRFWPLGAAVTHIDNKTVTGLPSSFESHLDNSKINFHSQRHIPTGQLNNSLSDKVLMHTNFLLASAVSWTEMCFSRNCESVWQG